MKKFLLVVLLIAGGVYYFFPYLINLVPALEKESNFKIVGSKASSGNAAVASSFSNRNSGSQVSGSGKVIRILADDSKGSQHQRFILALSSGQTLLVAHNIDLAPRISSLRVGDTVDFYGQYEWNPEGGVIHWTHHDPPGGSRHTDGWLKHKGRVYQ